MLVSTSEEALCEGMQAFCERHFGRAPAREHVLPALDTLGSPHLLVLRGEGMIRMREYPRSLAGPARRARRRARDLAVSEPAPAQRHRRHHPAGRRVRVRRRSAPAPTSSSRPTTTGRPTSRRTSTTARSPTPSGSPRRWSAAWTSAGCELRYRRGRVALDDPAEVDAGGQGAEGAARSRRSRREAQNASATAGSP